ncbi:putative NADH-ubiquinone reductase complex 1 MLRQ subunit [Helianthus annuus]|nr:putative NADH-ubiquinone reductase complex 1 MLRQ subunit [Helianthus annuus]
MCFLIKLYRWRLGSNVNTLKSQCFRLTCLFNWAFIYVCMYRVNKENRAAGVLDNFAEGERYAEHSLRKFVRNKSPEIMPNLNSFFADPK